MDDTFDSSKHVDSEEPNLVEKGANLVETIDDTALNWVGEEPRGIASLFSHTRRQAYIVVEYGGDQEGFQLNFKIMRPMHATRICSEFTHNAFPMYEVIFKDLGLRLPFNDF